jgi:hypothetical protein
MMVKINAKDKIDKDKRMSQNDLQVSVPAGVIGAVHAVSLQCG